MGYEVADLKLNADLTVLSACETGRGKVMPGEGVLGLPRLFLGAGANTVLMTHWKIYDKFAPGLMSKFYNYYLNQGLPKARTLTEAKRRILNSPQESANANYRHPLYWAAFVMYGEPGYKLIEEENRFIFLAIMFVVLTTLVVFYLIYIKDKHNFAVAKK